MRTSCGCGYDADPRVFGPCRDCKPKPATTPAGADLVGAVFGAIDRARQARREDFTLSPRRDTT